jgi:DNA repair protein RecO (recombination protein O)
VPVYKTNALVLRRIPLGETDKILTLFTREYGKISVIAKGARRTTSRKSAGTEPLTLIRALLAEGRNLDVLTQVETRASFPLITGNFGLFLRATYACELVDRLTIERDPAGDVFDLLLATLYVLQRAVDPDAALHAYELKLMALAGYEPQLDACVVCERMLGEAEPPGGYSALRGGALCRSCADSEVREDLLPFPLEALWTLQTLLATHDPHELAALVLPEPARDPINRALHAHLRFHLERDVRSSAILDALRVGALDTMSLAPEDVPALLPP